MSEQLVVVSKVKKYIKGKAGMNTSSTAFEELSKIVTFEIGKAIENAQSDNRKTVMDRDFNHEKQC